MFPPVLRNRRSVSADIRERRVGSLPVPVLFRFLFPFLPFFLRLLRLFYYYEQKKVCLCKRDYEKKGFTFGSKNGIISVYGLYARDFLCVHKNVNKEGLKDGKQGFG
jgi:hypothetical protein